MTATHDIKVRVEPRHNPVTPPGSYIDPHARVGHGCTIGRNVYIGPHVTIGADCVIGPGSVIGSDGFGYEWEDGVGWQRKPQTCGVVIEDDVHIGANTCIDRGSYRDTFIGSGTRIDNLVHIAHNVIVGPNCLVIACAELSGSVELGEGAQIAPNACVREHLTIGAGALVGLGAVAVTDVPAGETWVGNPARRLEAKRPEPVRPSPMATETKGGSKP